MGFGSRSLEVLLASSLLKREKATLADRLYAHFSKKLETTLSRRDQ
jgi:hypothetical protein